MDMPTFAAVLQALQNPDNAVRSQAETQYNGLTTPQKNALLLEVIQNTISGSNDAGLFTQAAVLLRRLITSDFKDVYAVMNDADKTAYRQHLLQLLTQPFAQQRVVRKKLIDISAELSRKVADLNIDEAEAAGTTADQTTKTNGSPLQTECVFVVHALATEDAHLLECALLLIIECPLIIASDMSSPQWQAARTSLSRLLLYNGASPALSQHIRQLAARAVMNAVLTIEDEMEETKLKRMFNEDLRQVVNILQAALQNADDETEDLVKVFVDFIETVPKIVKGWIPQIFDALIRACKNEEVPIELRRVCIEAMVAYCEAAPAIVRKSAHAQLDQLLHLLLIFMTNLNDDPSWNEVDPNDKEDEDDDEATLGETSLDRVCIAIGGKTMITPMLQLAKQLIQSNDWKHRHAGLMALSASGEGMQKEMQKHLSEIVPVVVERLRSDPHARVRYATCNCLGQMSTDFSPQLQKRYGKVILPALLTAIESDAHYRVQTHAACALVNFCEDGQSTAVLQYVDMLAERLHAVLLQRYQCMQDRHSRITLEAIVVAISSVADTLEEDFGRCYDRFMPVLKLIVQDAGAPDQKMLRGKAIEALTLVGLTVDKEKFFHDAEDVMQALLKTQMGVDGQGGEPQLSPDDPQHHYMMQAWARICTILGKDFARFLPLVMPRVLQVASHTPQINVIDEDDVDSIANTGEWEFVNLTGDKRTVGIKTSGLEDKKEAMRLLEKYADACEEGFIQYCEPVTQLMAESLSFVFDEGVRTRAADALPALLRVAKTRGPDFQHQMWNYIAPKLLDCMSKEQELEPLGGCFEAFGKCCEQLADPRAWVAPEMMHSLTAVMTKSYELFFEQTTRNDSKRKDSITSDDPNAAGGGGRTKKGGESDEDEEYDDNVDEYMQNAGMEYSALISSMSECIESLFKLYGEGFCAVFDNFIPYVDRLMEDTHTIEDKQWAICTWISVVKFCGAASRRYAGKFIQHITNGLTDERPEVRQSSAFCFGMLAEHGGGQYTAECSQVVPQMFLLIEGDTAREDENGSVADNAISTLVRYMRFLPPQALAHYGNVEDLYEKFAFSWLPITHDDEESANVYGYLADLLESNNLRVLGPNGANLPRIAQTVSQALIEQTLAEDCCKAAYDRLMHLMMQIALNAEAYATIKQHLDADQIEALESNVSEYQQKMEKKVVVA